MEIIPVLDLYKGLVVRGIGGERNEYKPIKNSIITTSAYPLNVTTNFQKKLGLSRFYIADLDAIQRTEYRDVSKSKIKEMEVGQILEVLSNDPGSKEDFPRWARRTGNEIIAIIDEDDYARYFVKKQA